MNLNTVRTLTIRSRAEGDNETVAAMGRVGRAYDDTGKSALSLAEASRRMSDNLQKLARMQDDYVQQIRQSASANDNLANSYQAANDNAVKAGSAFHVTGVEVATMANHLKTAAAAAYVLSPAFRQLVNPAIAASIRALGPAAAAVGGTILSALTPAFAFISRIALPVWAAVEAWKAMNAITELGAQRLQEFASISSGAAAGGVSTDFFQRTNVAAKALNLTLDDTLKKFKDITTEKLGGSDFEKRLKELSEAATTSSSGATNFAGNSGVAAFRNAVTAEERWRAVTVLITKAMEAGERLAALDLAAKFLPPEMLERLRANGNLLAEMQAAADNTKAAEIFTPEQIGYGIEIKRRLDQANETIANRLKPLQKDLTDLGLQYQESWVKLVELLAGAVTGLTAIYGWVKSLDGIFNSWGNAAWIKALNRWMDSKGLTSLPEGAVNTGTDGTTPVGNMGDAAMQAARDRLAGLLRDTKAVQAAMLETTNSAYKVVGDKSQEPAKAAAAVNAVRDAWDRAVESASKNIATVEAEAAAVGKSTGEHAKLRIEAQLTEAAQRAGIEITGEAAEQYRLLGERAAAAATALAKAQIANDISRDRQMVFLSQEDVEIANKLKGLFPDIATALKSPQAEAMRFNNMLKNINEAAGSALSSFSKDIAKGVDPMKALATQAEKFAESIIDVASKQIIGNLMGDLFGSLTGAATQTATQTAGATSAATILTGAGTTVAASMIAGATQAAAILGLKIPAAAASLPVAGTATSTQIVTGSTTGGAALAAGGNAAGLALWGPIALLVAAVAAIGFLSDDDDEQAATALRIQRLENRQRLAELDTDTLAGKLEEFDLNASLERASLEGGGKTQQDWTNKLTFGLFGDAGGDITEEAIALEKTLAAERLQVIAEFNEDALEAEKTRIETAQKLAQDAIDTLANIELSDIAQRMADITSAGTDLLTSLTALGASTEDVAGRISDAVVALQDTFSTDLLSSLNDLTGRGFLNDMVEAAEEFSQRVTDAAAIGMDEFSTINRIYVLQAQEIVDQNQLVGDSFQELINLYPELTGQIHAYTGAVTKSISEIASELASLQTRLFNATNDSTTLEGALAEFERNAALERATTDLSNLVLLEEVLAAERLEIITDFNDKALQAQQDLLDAQQDLLDDARSYLVSFDNSIKSWLNNYLGGASSPLSPQAALTKAQTDYQTQYNLTQTASGQALRDALSSITSYADTYLNAAEGFYASSSGFQNISDTVTGQLATLPDAISPEQLIVDSVNAASTAIVSAQQAMQTALTSVLQTGNLSAISSVLSNYLPQIDTNTDNGISLAEMQVAFGTNYNTGMQAAINQVFAELDNNGNGLLEKSELIKAATTNTSTNTSNTTVAVNNTGGDTVGAIDNNGAILSAIQSLNSTSAQQLQILNESFSTGQPTNINMYYLSGAFFGSASLQNTVAQALNKIVYNTYVIAENTGRHYSHVSAAASIRIGTLATGGTIPAGGLALVSEHSPGGGRFIRAGAEPITVSPYSPGNDNSAVVTELRELRTQMARMEQRLVHAELAGATMVVEATAEVAAQTKTANKVARRAA